MPFHAVAPCTSTRRPRVQRSRPHARKEGLGKRKEGLGKRKEEEEGIGRPTSHSTTMLDGVYPSPRASASAYRPAISQTEGMTVVRSMIAPIARNTTIDRSLILLAERSLPSVRPSTVSNAAAATSARTAPAKTSRASLN
jgi:hypothetical protein